MESTSEQISQHAKFLEIGHHVYRSLNCLLRLEASLAEYKSYEVKHLAMRYSKNSEYAGVAKELLAKIQKLEDDSVFRKPYNVTHPVHRNRRRTASMSLNSSKFSPKRPKISTPEYSYSWKPSLSFLESFTPDEFSSIEVSKLSDLEESDYDRVRPTLITLSAKQLKSFMDRNPRMEIIGDGLFRRHCQMDCPEEVPKKLTTETWRTLHDVYTNWKLYKEAKVWEKKINEGLKNYSKIKQNTQ